MEAVLPIMIICDLFSTLQCVVDSRLKKKGLPVSPKTVLTSGSTTERANAVTIIRPVSSAVLSLGFSSKGCSL